jgi:hypothetical protein
MNCENFEQLIGMRCNPVGDAVGVITPFAFPQQAGSQVHFFDDGFTLMHLHGVGIDLTDTKRWQPLRAIADVHGTTLNKQGVFEVLWPAESAAQGFARLVSTLLGVASWEREQVGVSQDSSWLVDEVAMYMRQWKPSATVNSKPPAVKGFSGKMLTFDLEVGCQFVDAINPRGQSTNAAIRKFVELNTSETNREYMVIVDDRTNPEAAKQEVEIIGQVGVAWPMSKLIQASGAMPMRTMQ